MNILGYLMSALNSLGDFSAQWRNLSETDKDDLKRYATEEMAVIAG